MMQQNSFDGTLSNSQSSDFIKESGSYQKNGLNYRNRDRLQNRFLYV